jgi:agmatine/peptidylarginine deiminase
MQKTLLVACVVLIACGPQQARRWMSRPRAFIEHTEPSVLVVALGVDVDVSSGLRDVQLQIVAKAARNGPVLVLATTSEQQSRLSDMCLRYDDLCQRLHDGIVRVAVEPHRGPWIRDYGPFITMSTGGSVAVIDARYDDARRRSNFEYRRERLNNQRLVLIEQKLRSAGRGSSLFDEDSTALKAQEDMFLHYGAELSQLLKDESDSRERAMDDDAPFYIAQAAIGHDHFDLVHSSIYLDGGNLLHLQDGTCLTTTDTLAKNNGDKPLVERELAVTYHCDKVAFLEGLPGEGIIKHVDMFLMPVWGQTLLLASYDPESTRFQERFSHLDSELRTLVVESAIAMRHNKLQLQRLGYTVIDVPSLFPQRSRGEQYFPTLLNGIVQVGSDGRRHLLIPDYDVDNEDDIAVKLEARQAIGRAFGIHVDIQIIESTVPATMQGALHCLSNTVPLSGSLFTKGDEVAAKIRNKVDKVITMPDQNTGRPDRCLDDMHGEWVKLDELSMHVSPAKEHEFNTITIRPATLLVISKSKKRVIRHTASCVAEQSHAALLRLKMEGGISHALLRVEGDTLDAQFENGDHYTFIRRSAVLKGAWDTSRWESSSSEPGEPSTDELSTEEPPLDELSPGEPSPDEPSPEGPTPPRPPASELPTPEPPPREPRTRELPTRQLDSASDR